MSLNHAISTLDRLLKPLGFARKKTTWNRVVGQFVDVLDVQLSKYANSLTLNAGVLEKKVYRECWGKKAEEFVEEPFCVVRVRIGELIDQKDKWWSIDDGEAAEDIVNNVKKLILPFFERLHSLDAMRQWLIQENVVEQKYPPPAICLAILEHCLGRKEEACAILSALLAKISGAWRAKVGEVAKRLACS